MTLPQEQARDERAQQFLLHKLHDKKLVRLAGTELPCLVIAGEPSPLCPVHREAYKRLCQRGDIVLSDLPEWTI